VRRPDPGADEITAQGHQLVNLAAVEAIQNSHDVPVGGRHACVKIEWVPADAGVSLGLEPAD